MEKLHVMGFIILTTILMAIAAYLIWRSVSERARIYRDFVDEVRYAQKTSTTTEEFLDRVDVIKSRFRYDVSDNDMTKVIASIHKTLL